MLKKIMIAVALSSGLMSSGFALTQQELVAALNTPEAQAKIKEQVAALVREKGLPAVDDQKLIALQEKALQYQLLAKVGEQLEKFGKKEEKTAFGHLKSVCAGLWKNGGKDVTTQILLFTLVIKPAIFYAIQSALAPGVLVPTFGTYLTYKLAIKAFTVLAAGGIAVLFPPAAPAAAVAAAAAAAGV